MHEIQPVSESRLTGSTMTSVLSNWLSGKALFFRYISEVPPGWSGGYLTPLQCITLSSLSNKNLRALFSLEPTLIFQLPASHLSPHIYPHSLHLIPPPHIPTQPASHLSPHIYLHSLHLIQLPTSYLHSLHLIYPPTYTYTAYISFIPLHIPTQPTSHLPPTHTYIYIPHIPTQPACYLSPRFNS